MYILANSTCRERPNNNIIVKVQSNLPCQNEIFDRARRDITQSIPKKKEGKETHHQKR